MAAANHVGDGPHASTQMEGDAHEGASWPRSGDVHMPVQPAPGAGYREEGVCPVDEQGQAEASEPFLIGWCAEDSLIPGDCLLAGLMQQALRSREAVKEAIVERPGGYTGEDRQENVFDDVLERGLKILQDAHRGESQSENYTYVVSRRLQWCHHFAIRGFFGKAVLVLA